MSNKKVSLLQDVLTHKTPEFYKRHVVCLQSGVICRYEFISSLDGHTNSLHAGFIILFDLK